jgi:hypothetical protein
MTNINDPWRDDEVTRTLNDLPPVDPPSTLVNDVMSTIASRSAARATHSSFIPTKRGGNMAKKVLWIVAATAALALIAMRLVGYPPVEKGTEATIGAAQRYQSPQISSADVKTQDAQLQAFLQSDVFRQLTTDKTARQALKNQDFQKALQDPAVRAALASSDVRFVIGNLRVADAAALAKSDVKSLAKSDVRFQAALDASPSLKAAFESSPALRAALASQDVIAAMNSKALDAVLSKADVAMLVSSDVVLRAVLSAPDAALDAATAAGSAAGGVKRDAVGVVAK